MDTRERLMDGHGNAMLVAGSIHAACRLYDMFQQIPLADHCAIVTSYVPAAAGIKGETTGEGETDKLFKYETYRRMLARHFDEPEATALHKVAQFEKEVKQCFIYEPGHMKLLIVVDRLLTGTRCAAGNLSLEKSIQDYTGKAFDGFDQADVEGLLEDRLAKARERLDEARETLKALCEAVPPPADSEAFRHYFVGSSDALEEQRDNAPKRAALYTHVAAYLRAYANIANEMAAAGYTVDETAAIKREVAKYDQLRDEIKLASGDYVDMKLFEPGMRHLLDTYICAEDSEKLSAFDDMTLVELIIERGEEAVEALPDSI